MTIESSLESAVEAPEQHSGAPIEAPIRAGGPHSGNPPEPSTRLRTRAASEIAPTPRIRITAWSLAAVLATTQFLAARYFVNPDGLSYLDLADQYASGRWEEATNLYWSPVYPGLLAIALRVLGPSPFWESTVAHAVNVVLAFAAFAAFEFLIRSISRLPAGHLTESDAAGDTRDRRSMMLLGYALGLWAIFGMIGMTPLTPDLSVAASVFMAAGFIIRIQTDGPTWTRYVGLGAAVGIGYLSKAAMFPLAPFFLAAGAVAAGDLRRGARGLAVGGLVFVAIAGPQVVALSALHGGFTFGENRTYAYAALVNGVSIDEFWAGRAPGAGEPRSGPAILHEDPVVRAFDAAAPGTYPFWYAPSRWLAGLTPQFRFADQIQVLLRHLRGYVLLTLPIWLGLLVIAFAGEFRGIALRDALRSQAVLMIPALAGLGMYALVYVEPRYIAPFVPLVALGAFDAARQYRRSDSQRTFRAAVGAVAVAAVLMAAWTLPDAVLIAARSFRQAPGIAHEQWAIAEGLRALGVKPGDRIANIGRTEDAYWARLAGAKIVAEVPAAEAASVWLRPGVREGVIRALSGSAVGFVVAEPPADWPIEAPWIRIGDTGFILLAVDR